MLAWIIRLTLALIFLIMFLIRGNRAWGIGLLTVSAIVFLDALRSRQLLDDIGYLGYAIGGILAAGMFLWLIDLLRTNTQSEVLPSFRSATDLPTAKPSSRNNQSAFDRQLLFEQIRDNLGADDVLDLIFDLDLKENSIINPAQAMPHSIMAVLDQAEAKGQMAQVAMSVERILTPMQADHLPRKVHISAETPPHLLRQFLTLNYSDNDLAVLASKIGVAWQDMGSDAKKSRVRRLLLHAKRRGLLKKLLQQINPTPAV